MAEKTVFKSLAFFTTGTGREIRAHYRKIFKISTDHTPFTVILFNTAAVFYMFWRMSGQNSRTAISLFLCRKPVMFIAHLLNEKKISDHIRGSFNFLKAYYICISRLQPRQPVFAQCRADPINVV